jgi:5'-nucleotidase / UDP-sugar diphosphatase
MQRSPIKLLIISCLLVMPIVAVEAAPAPQLRFTILHTNDLHSHDLPFSDHTKLIGGMPRIAKLLADRRAKRLNSVTIDAGDIFEGTPFFTYYRGSVEVKLLNEAHYDIYTIGNHEFDDGPENLAAQLKHAKFSIINCNMDTSAYPKLQELVRPSTVKTIAGERIAFVGAICPDLAKVTYRVGNVKVINADGDWMSPIRAEILRLKQQGIDKIILVTHVGVERDKLLAQLPDVDVIIGGHSHTRLERPIIVQHEDDSHCVVVQTGCYGRAVGQLDLAFNSGGQVDVDQIQYELIDITEDMPVDQEMSKHLQQKSKPFRNLQNEFLSEAVQRLDNDWPSFPGDSPLGNLVTDAMADSGSRFGATIALQNRGGIRSGIEKGRVSEESVRETLPFANFLTVCTISGKDLRNILETSVGGNAEEKVVLGAQFLDVHGLKFEWNPKLPTLHRVDKIWVANGSGDMEPLLPEGQYRIATNDYSFSTEGFDFSRAVNVVKTRKRLSTCLHDYLLKQKTVDPKVEGRIVPLAAIP